MSDNYKDDRSPEEVDRDRTVLALLAGEDENGRHLAALSKAEAHKLLGNIATPNVGQGQFIVDIPAKALEEAGVNMERWNRAIGAGLVKEDIRGGDKHYKIEDYMFSARTMEVLQAWAETTYEKARETVEKFA